MSEAAQEEQQPAIMPAEAQPAAAEVPVEEDADPLVAEIAGLQAALEALPDLEALEEPRRNLKQLLVAAKAAKVARDSARSDAEKHLQQGERALEARDYPKAIAAFRDAGGLDTQSSQLADRVQTSLAAAEASLAAQGVARAEAAEHVATAEACMSTKDHKGAIAAYEAAAALDVNDAERTSSYTSGAESARSAMDAAVEEARGHRADGQSAVSSQDWESAIESLTAGLAVKGTHDDDLTSSLQEALQSAQSSMAARDAAREKAEQHFVDGESMLSSRKYEQAIEELEAGLELDTQSEDLQGRLRAVLASAREGLDAQEAARAEAAEHVATAEACMSTRDHKGAIAAYEAAAALDVNDAERTSSYTSGAESARSAMGFAWEEARGHRADGQSAVSSQDWESAIESLTAGLAVKGTHDDDLTSSLQEALQSAQSSMAARDAAREKAEQHFVDGESMLSSRKYEQAIEELEAGLELDTQSEDLQGRLRAVLASAREGLDAQEAARAEAAEHVATAEACMSTRDHKGAIAAYEAAAALDVNDAERTSSYTSGAESARSAMDAAVEEARGHRADGQSAVSSQDWESAIESLTAGLAVKGTHDDDLTSSLQEALQSAQSSMAARDAAREKAEQHFVDGESMLSSRKYEQAIEELEAGLELDTQSEDLQGRLRAVLASAREGLDAQEAARAEAAEHVATAEACMGAHDFEAAIESYSMALSLDVNSSDLSRIFRSGALTAKKALASALEAARGMLADGQKAVAAYGWESAIELFTAGLAVDGVNDQRLKSQLRGGLKSAEASMGTRDAARVKAQDYFAKGKKLLEDRLYEGAIDEFKAGLDLDTQSDDMINQLQKNLSSAKAQLAAQKAARAEAARLEREAADQPQPTAEEAEVIRQATELAEARQRGDKEQIKILEAAEDERKIRQADRLKQVWDDLDQDRSGTLDASEIKQLLLRIGRTEDSNAVLKEVDVDQSGAVDYDEFCDWFQKIAGPQHGDHMRQLSWQGHEQMQIFVVNAHAQKFKLWVSRSEAIQSVRAKIQDKEGHLYDDESIITYDPDGTFGDLPPVVLQDGRTLAYYGIPQNAILTKQRLSP